MDQMRRGLSAGSNRTISRIAKIETFAVPPRWLFVRVQTDDGLVGWGEASLEGHTEAVEGAFASLRDRALGADADRIEDIWQTAYRLGFYRGGPVLMSAISGLDQALWDIKGRRLGVPISSLLGGKLRERIPVYGWIGGDRPSDVVEAAKRRRAEGFTAVKMNGTEDLGWLDSTDLLDEVGARVASVRAEGLRVGVDFHGRVHRGMAKQLAEVLAPLRPMFIEEPVLSEHPEALAALAALTSIPIAMGERLFSRWDFKPFLPLIDVAQPDLSHAGGISEVRRIASMCEAYDVAIAPHCPLGPLAFAACLQIAAATPNFAIQEMSLGIHYNREDADLSTYLRDATPFDVTNGTVATLEGPGLGIEIDEDLVRDAASRPFTWRNPAWRGPDGELREW